MDKKLLLLYFNLLLFSITYAQTVIVTYKQNFINITPNSKNNLPSIDIGSARFEKNLDKDLLTYTLTYSDGISYFENSDFSKLLNRRFTSTDTIKESSTSTKINHYTQVYDNDKLRNLQRKIYKNFENEEAQAIFYLDGIRQYNVKDKLFKQKYMVTNETKKILGYLCKKAVLSSGAYAWFTTSLSIPAGPEFFHGLPGLILEYQGKYSEWVATNIQIKKANTKISDLRFTGTVYSNAELVKIQMEDQNKTKFNFPSKIKRAEVKRYQFN